MMILCKNCGIYNDSANNFCHACGVSLSSYISELDVIRKEIFALKKEYELKISDLLAKIDSYEKHSVEEVVELETQEVEEVFEAITNTICGIKLDSEVEIEKEIVSQYIEDQSVLSHKGQEVEVEEKAEERIQTGIREEVFEPESEELAYEKPQKSLMEIVMEIPVVSTLLEEIASPFVSLWGFAQKTYYTYKEKNQLPVFFMTLAGVGALLFGFGYLMQLSIGYFGELSEVIKIAIGFACSTGITFWATRLYGRGDKYKDFSSALIGLAVALNYLFVYFLSDLSDTSHFLTSPFLGFGLIITNTVFAIVFALKYETKIVAVLSLLGGAFAPFYLNSSESSPLYFLYLWLLCSSSIYVAQKIQWKTLGVLSFITSASIIGLAVYNDINAYTVWIYMAIFHAFAYLFVWYGLFDGNRIATKLNKNKIFILAADISLFLFNLFYLFSENSDYTTLGVVYAVNALIFFPGIWLSFPGMSKQMRLLIFVLTGTFIAFAIPALFDKQLMGFFWSAEALVLLFLGYIFVLPSVRKEAYVLLLIAIGKTALTFDNIWIFTYPEIQLSSGYYNLLSLGIIFAAILVLHWKYKDQHLDFEHQFSVLFKNIISTWFLVAYGITIAYFTADWFSFATIMATLAIIAIGYKQKLIFTKVIGYIGFIGCTVYALAFGLLKIFLNCKDSILHSGYANLAGVGLFLATLLVLTQWLHKKKSVPLNIEAHTTRISNLLSVWFTIFFLVSGLNIIGIYTTNIAIIPMFGLIYLGHKRKLLFTEYLGLAYSIIILSGFAYPAYDNNTLRLSMLPIVAKISLLEFLFCMWFLKMFYDKNLHGNKKSMAMDVVREIFYWIVPLIILSPVHRHLPEFFPATLWISVLISFLLHEGTKRISLFYELYILLIAAIYTGLSSEFYYYSIPASVVVLAIISIKKQIFKRNNIVLKNYLGISVGLPYYIGASVFVVTLKVLDVPVYALVAFSVYMAVITFFREKIAPLQSSAHVAFILSFAVTSVAILINMQSDNFVDKIIVFAPVVLLGIIHYGKRTIVARDNGNIWITTTILLHLMILAGYSMLLSQTWLTVVFIFHAIVVLFNSMKKHCKPLVWQSVGLFAIALIKLFYKDIADFSMSQKVVVFVLIGVLLLGASFLYVKIRDRFDENGEDNRESDDSNIAITE